MSSSFWNVFTSWGVTLASDVTAVPPLWAREVLKLWEGWREGGIRREGGRDEEREGVERVRER